MDSRLATHQASSADIGGQENPIEPHDVPHDATLLRKSDEGGDTSDSDDDDQLSVADAASMACASGEDSRAMAKDDQDAGCTLDSLSGYGYWTHSRSTFDERLRDQSQLNSLQAMYGTKDRRMDHVTPAELILHTSLLLSIVTLILVRHHYQIGWINGYLDSMHSYDESKTM